MKTCNYLLVLICGLMALCACNNSEGNGDPDVPVPTVAERVVEAHNKLRSAVGVQDIQWSQELADSARNCAANFIQTCGGPECTTLHGQLEFYTFPDPNVRWSWEAVVGGWSDNGTFYNYEADTCAFPRNCDSYKQIVWANTTEVGCFQATCSNGSNLWICHYNPKGNVEGERPY